MDIAVLVKTALDTSYLRIDPGSNRPLLENMPLKISDIDRNAVEEAVKLKQSGVAKKISIFTALTWGPLDKRVSEAQNVLREALAMGADEAYIIADPNVVGKGPLVTSKVLAKALKMFGEYKLILCGEATIDMFTSQIPPRVAAEMEYNLVTFARSITIDGDTVKVERDLENYLEVVETKLPAVVSVTREINTPRLPTLLQIRLAVKKPIKVLSLKDIDLDNVEGKTRYSYIGVHLSRKNIMIEAKNVDELADKLIEIIRKES